MTKERVTVNYLMHDCMTGERVTKTFVFSGFWRKVDTYEEQPDIHFLHQLILILETDHVDRRIGWSTIQNFNHLLGESARVPTVKVRSSYHSNSLYEA